MHMAEQAEKRKVAIPPFEIVKNERDRLKRQKQRTRSLIKFAEFLIVTAAISMIIATRFLTVLEVTGFSMKPTLQEGEIVVIAKNSDVASGDVIGFYHQNRILIKRIIGKPGDMIEITEAGAVLVNGTELEEPYITKFALGECDIEFPYYVPARSYFVMGDHRVTSTDSRSSEIGCVSEDQIIGRVVIRIWPWESVKVFNKEN